MNDDALDPVLEALVAREVAAGNAIAGRGAALDGRPAVRLARPFHEEYLLTLDAPGVHYRRERMSDPRADAEYDDEYFETATSIVAAPTPQKVERGERRDRARGIEAPEDRRPSEGPLPVHDLLAQIADSIERELRRLGVWLKDPPSAPPKFQRAFGGDVMPFTDWIQLVMLPRMREIAAKKAPLPGPGVAAYAVRELDGQDEFATLLDRLGALDRLVRPLHGPSYSVVDRRHLISGVVVIAAGLALALVGFVIATMVNESLDRGMPDRVLASFEIDGFTEGTIHSVEARVEAVIRGDDAIEPETFSLVTARSSALRVMVRPLDIEAMSERAKDAGAIGGWLRKHGAEAGGAAGKEDALRLAGLVRTVLGMKSLVVLKAGVGEAGLKSRMANEPYRFHPKAPESTHYAILIASLLALLAPLPFLAVWLRRRFA